MKSSIEGIIKVMIWLRDKVITHTEFTEIYLEWLRKRKYANLSLLNLASSFHLPWEQEDDNLSQNS